MVGNESIEWERRGGKAQIHPHRTCMHTHSKFFYLNLCLFDFRFFIAHIPCICIHFRYFRRLAFIQLVLCAVCMHMWVRECVCVNVFVSCAVLYVPDFVFYLMIRIRDRWKHTHRHTDMHKCERKSLKRASNGKRKIKKHNQKNFGFFAFTGKKRKQTQTDIYTDRQTDRVREQASEQKLNICKVKMHVWICVR